MFYTYINWTDNKDEKVESPFKYCPTAVTIESKRGVLKLKYVILKIFIYGWKNGYLGTPIRYFNSKIIFKINY